MIVNEVHSVRDASHLTVSSTLTGGQKPKMNYILYYHNVSDMNDNFRQANMVKHVQL